MTTFSKTIPFKTSQLYKESIYSHYNLRVYTGVAVSVDLQVSGTDIVTFEAFEAVEAVEAVESVKGRSLFTSFPRVLHLPLQFIQHPLCFRLSFINHTVKRNTHIKTAGTIRMAPLTDTLTKEHTNQNKNVKTIPERA
jgi:hypothetical protein